MSETVFVTGALGCIGAWVARAALDRGDQVVAFDPGASDHRLVALLNDDELSSIVRIAGDVTDGAAVRDAMAEHGVTRIVHLAGLQVPFCRADPALGARVNVVGTINIFEAAKSLGISRVSYASSAAVFGPDPDGEPDESAPLGPTTHYGVFKQANEGTAAIYAQDDGVYSAGLRPLTVYGPGRDQGLTSGPTCALKAAVCGRPFVIRFSGATDFLFVEDAAAAFLSAADAGPDGASVYNVHGETSTLGAFVALADEALPESSRGLILVEGDPIPIPPALDGRALHAAFHGLSTTDLAEGVRRTIDSFTTARDAGRLDTRDIDDE